MSREYNIPETWVRTSIEEIILYQKGKKPKRLQINEFEDSVPYLDIKAFEKKEIRQYADKQSSQIIDENDVVMVWDGARSGWVSKGMNGALGSTIARFRPFLIPQKYLYYFLTSQFSYLNTNAKGTGIPHVDPQVLFGIKMPFPPFNEQHRIVEIIEELFSDLDNGIANLKLAQYQLKVYRQALLKHAFEGKLTEKWREENNPEPAEKLLKRIKEERQNRYEQESTDWKKALKQWDKDGKKGERPSRPSKPIIPDKPNDIHQSKKWELPNDWKWTQLGWISFVTKLAGFEYTKYVKYDENGDLAVIKAENAGPYGFKKTDYSKIKSKTISHLKRSQLSGGELLIVFVGAGTGNVAVVPLNNKFFLGPNIGMARPYTGIESKYLEYFFQSPKGKDILMVTAKAVAQPSLSMATIRQSPLAITSKDEQNQIVQLIESQFSIIEKLELTIESSLKKSEALRQSILKKAFEGNLVAQDPNDEPASELLKRIQIEKKQYLEVQKEQKKITPKKIKKMAKELSIEEVLKASEKPLLAKDVWQQSKHKDNIEEFYAELKKIQQSIKEVKKGTESLLSLTS